MTKPIAILGAVTLVMLAACSKPAPTDPSGAAGAAPAIEPPPVQLTPEQERSAKLTELLDLLDTAPQCEEFRAQLQQVAERTPLDQPLPKDVIQVIAKAHEAGCSRKAQ